MSDEELLTEYGRSGSHTAFSELYRRLFPRLVRFLLSRHCLNRLADAEDISQNVFLNVLRKGSSFRGECTAYTWIVKIAINRIISIKRMHLEPSFTDCNSSFQWREDRQGEPFEALAERQERDNINRVIETELTEDGAQIIRLLDIEGLDYEVAAERLGIPVGTVRSRRHRAMNRLRELVAAGVLFALGVCSGLGAIT